MPKSQERVIKDEFLEKAFSYLIANGLENASIRDMHEKTGISSGSIYYWFGCKEDMIIQSAKYGLASVSNTIFNNAFLSLEDPASMVDKLIINVEEHSSKLKFIYQVATSPVYGSKMRSETDRLTGAYDSHITKLAEVLKCDFATLQPLVYMLVAVILDFVIWEERDKTELMLKKINELLLGITKNGDSSPR